MDNVGKYLRVASSAEELDGQLDALRAASEALVELAAEKPTK